MVAKTGKPVSLLQPFYKYSKTGKTKMVWTTYDTVYPSKTTNPTRRLNPNRLTPVAFNIKGQRHTGKAKLVGGKVKIFVTPGVARKINPRMVQYEIYNHKTGDTFGRVFPTKKEADSFIRHLKSQTSLRLYWKARKVK